jgi:hypothetical protein
MLATEGSPTSIKQAKVNVLEREKTNAAEVHVAELNEIEEKMAKETQDYSDYRLSV